MGVLSNIREHREELVGFDDLLNYAFLIRGAQTHEPAVVLLKDGALLRAWYFQGPDLDYAAEEELERRAKSNEKRYTTAEVLSHLEQL